MSVAIDRACTAASEGCSMRYRTPRMRDRRVTTLLRGLLFSTTSARRRHGHEQTSVEDAGGNVIERPFDRWLSGAQDVRRQRRAGGQRIGDRRQSRDSHMSIFPYHMLVNPTPIPRHSWGLAHISGPRTCRLGTRTDDKTCCVVQVRLRVFSDFYSTPSHAGAIVRILKLASVASHDVRIGVAWMLSSRRSAPKRCFLRFHVRLILRVLASGHVQ
jgi:hypothetical protein